MLLWQAWRGENRDEVLLTLSFFNLELQWFLLKYPSSIVVDHLENSAKHPNGHVGLIGVAYFYCDYHDKKDQNATSLIGSLLAQFISQLNLEDIPLEIIASFDDAEKKGTSLQLEEAVMMLTTVLQGPQWGFICIDALDELELAAQRTVLHSLRELVHQAGSNASIFLTGRPTVKPEVDQQLCKRLPQPLTSSHFEIEITASANDIKHFLLHYIEEKDQDPSAMNEVLKQKILDTITEKSDGMYVAKWHPHVGIYWLQTNMVSIFRFLLPALHIQSILDEPSVGHREDALKTLPTGVHAAYMQTINRIQRQPKTRANQGMTALYWVALASRPLSVTEISHALAVRIDSAGEPFDISRVCSTKTLLACCMGLVTIGEGTSTARLVHYSLQKFLQNDNDPEVNIFHIHTGHGLIAKTCLTYLRFCQSMTLGMAGSCACCQRYHGGIVPAYHLYYPDGMPWEQACMCQSEFPLFEYASSEWGNHVREGYDTSIRSLAMEWLTSTETESCPCAMIYISMARDIYRSSSCSIKWGDYHSRVYTSTGQQTHNSMLVLHCIAYFGEQHILEEMATTVSQGELDIKDKQGWTPLTWAAVRGHDLCVKQLLQFKETEVDSVDVHGVTPLMHAAWHGNAKITKQLLATDNIRRGNLNAYDRDGRTAISYAAVGGHRAVIEILLREAELDPNFTCSESPKTPLMYAIQGKMTNAAKALLSNRRVDPTLEDIYSRDTPLHLAVETREVEVLKLLLQDPRVDPNHKNGSGYTPITLAARRGHTEVLEVLLQDPRVDLYHEIRGKYTLLALAASYGHAEAVKLLLGEPRVDPNHESRDGYTPLALAAICGHAETVKVLLGDPRVDPNHESRAGYTPLTLAATCGHTEAVKELLADPRVDPNDGGTDGYPPLALAAKYGHAESAKVLLGDPRVDANPIDSAGDTPLLISTKEYLRGGHYAYYGHILTDVLLTHPRVDRNARDSSGRTALSYFVTGDSLYLCSSWPPTTPSGVNLRIVKSLLEASGRADPNICDNAGKTALDWALSVDLGNSDECRELLRKYMSPQEML